MATRDTFLDALTIPSTPVRNTPPAPPKNPGWIAKPVALPPDPFTPKVVARPDFADDIDRIVAEMTAAGQVVFDAETQTFKAPPRRRMRFVP
jgi:hypothetical protein